MPLYLLNPNSRYLLEELPEPFRSGQAELGLKALHVVPIFVEGEYWGAAAFDDCRVARHRSTAELTALKITADCIGTAIQCDRAQQALFAAERERAAIAREQEQAAQARATELAKANQALKQAVDVLATETDLNHFIEQVLRLAAEQFEAPLAEYWQVTNPNLGRIVGWWGHQQMHGFGQDHEHPALESGVQVPLYMLEDRQFSDRSHHFVAPFDHSVAPAEGEFISDPAAWYASFGVSWQLNLPLLVGETCFGVLNFWQPSDRPFTEQQIELGYALAQQVTLAIRLSQLAEQAKQAAITREQEQAAQERAAHLARANNALQKTVDALGKIESVEEFIPVVLKIVLENFQATSCAFFEHAKGDLIYLRYWLIEGKVLNPTEILALDPDKYALIIRLAEGFTAPDEYLGTHARQRTRAVQLDHVVGTCVPEFDNFACACGWASELNVPCIIGEFADGGLVIYRGAGLPYSESEIALAETLSAQLALALQASRLAEEAKQAAIACEQEKAAQERVAELVRVNEELQQRDQLLSVVAQIAQNLLKAENVDIAIPAALQAVGEVANMSRVLLLLERRNLTTQQLQHCVEFEWVASGILDHAAVNLTMMDNKDFKVLVQSLYEGQSMWCIVNELPDVTRSRVEPLSIQSTGVVPIFIEGKYIGCIAFDDCVIPRHWTQPEIDVLTAAAESIGAILHRQLLVDRLIAERIQAAQAQAAELSRANTLLRNSLSRLSTNPNLDDVLGHLLVELVSYAGASVGHLFIYDAAQETLNLKARCRDEQVFWTPAEDEPVLFQAPIAVAQTQIFTQLRAQPRLAILNQQEFEGRMWQGVLEWFQAKDYRSTSSCILMVGHRPFGLLAMAFAQPIAFHAVEEELILALAQQIALVIQLTLLSEADKQSAIAREQEQAAQERVAELAKANEALKRSLTLLAEEPLLDKFLGYVLQTIADRLGDRSGAVYLYNDANHTSLMHLNYENGQMQQGEQITHPAATLPRPPRAWDEQYLPLLRQNQLLIHHDTEFDSPAYAPYRQHNRDRGIQTLLIVPMLFCDTLLGSITLRSTRHRDYTPEDLELAHVFAQQATLAVKLTHLAEQRRQTGILEERNRMAREIHDTIAQGLSGILIQLQAAEAIPDAIAQQEHLTQARQLAELSLVEARRSVQALRPQPLDTASLIDALTTLTHQLTRNAQVKAIVHMCGVPYALPSEVENHLFRIAQESITNVLKHAQANQLHLTLVYQPLQVQLTVQDNGQGFDPDRTSTFSYGMLGMQERAQAIGAVLTIISQPGQGTTIEVLLPVSPSVEESR